MNIWINKKTADLVLAHPQYEPVHISFDEKFYHDLAPEMKAMIGDRKVVHGALIQVGWLVQNKNNVWFGLPMSIQNEFEDLGDA